MLRAALDVGVSDTGALRNEGEAPRTPSSCLGKRARSCKKRQGWTTTPARLPGNDKPKNEAPSNIEVFNLWDFIHTGAGLPRPS